MTTLRPHVSIAIVLAAYVFSATRAEAAYVRVLRATDDSHWTAGSGKVFDASKTIDHSGMYTPDGKPARSGSTTTLAEHGPTALVGSMASSVNPASAWLSEEGRPTGATLTYHLGTPRNLQTIVIWNAFDHRKSLDARYRADAPGSVAAQDGPTYCHAYNRRAVKDVTIETSTDLRTWRKLPDANGDALGTHTLSAYEITPSDLSPDARRPASDRIELDGVEALAVRLVVHSNHGDPDSSALAEVRFYDDRTEAEAKADRVAAAAHVPAGSAAHGTQRRFFFDNDDLDIVYNVTRRMHRPEKLDGPLIQADKPWEHVTYFTCNAWNVVYDPKDEQFKCWYEDWMRDRIYAEPQHRIHGADNPSRYLFARSKDGIHWEKPALGIVEEDGHDTNIVLGGGDGETLHAAFFLLDPLEPDPQKRFKTLGDYRPPGNPAAPVIYRMFHSPDGIHWTIHPKPVIWGADRYGMGDVLTIAVDMETRTYLANNRKAGMILRPPHFGINQTFLQPLHLDRKTNRRVFQSESTDLINWTTPKDIVWPDRERDNIDDAFYGMAQYNSGGMWICFLNTLHMTENTMDVQLCYSRDGRTIKRFRRGTPWLERGPEGSWDQYMVNICNQPITRGDDLYVFHGGAKNHHDWWLRPTVDAPETRDFSRVGYGLGLARMKRDRFVSLHAIKETDGLIHSLPLSTQGTELVINARCGADGFIRAELTDAANRVLPGFSRDHCQPMTGDEVEHVVCWKNNPEIPTDHPIRVRFILRDADLFTWQLR